MAKVVSVDEFLDLLSHSRKPDIASLRHLILQCSPNITEHIKWNAPSFCVDGDDCLTMRLSPGDRLQLILHRGAKPKDASAFKFEDPTNLIEWAASDRGVITIPGSVFLETHKVEIMALIKRWIVAAKD